MKRFLLSLVAIVITSVCFAQDIIVKKDGSTIKTKVIKVTQSEVEYKKFSNKNGPTYTISTKDLQCINYENGTKDTFVSPNYNPNIVTNETATQFSNDQQLTILYNQERASLKKETKIYKIVGWGALAVGVVATGFLEKNADHPDAFEKYVPACIGVAACTSLLLVANHIENKSNYSVHSSPIFQKEFNIGKNDRMMVGVDMLKDNTRRNQTLGLGVSYNF